MIWYYFPELQKVFRHVCIDKLELYCDTWELEVNVTKTKVMVMLAGKTQIQGITFRGQELECVHSYKYLGLILSGEGSMKKMEVERVTKAKRASFTLRQAMSTTHNVSVKLHMSLFDKQIELILLYGCPIWGMPSSNCTVKVKGDCLNKTRPK